MLTIYHAICESKVAPNIILQNTFLEYIVTLLYTSVFLYSLSRVDSCLHTSVTLSVTLLTMTISIH